MLEIVVFDKYLIRGVDKCYGFSKVRDGREAKIIHKQKNRKVDGVDLMVDVPDYSNFGDETWPSTFGNCLRNVIDEEIKSSNIKGEDIEALKKIESLLLEVDAKISRIDEVFQAMNKRR